MLGNLIDTVTASSTSFPCIHSSVKVVTVRGALESWTTGEGSEGATEEEELLLIVARPEEGGEEGRPAKGSSSSSSKSKEGGLMSSSSSCASGACGLSGTVWASGGSSGRSSG